MKRVMLALSLVISSLTSFAQFSGAGSGTSNDPYKIFDAYQLNQIRNYLNQEGVVFKLMSDIDLTQWLADNNPGQGWEPIGTKSAPFKGILDGNGKTISGFFIDRSTTDAIGFFGYASGVTIKNLTINGSKVKGNKSVGAFIGEATKSTLSQIAYNGDIEAVASYAGGIVGRLVYGTVAYPRFTGSVTGVDYCGGIAGESSTVETKTFAISNAEVSGTISGRSTYVGGIAGTGSVSSSTFTGTVKGDSKVGGIAGASVNLSGNVSRGKVIGSNYIGGICGSFNGGGGEDYTTCEDCQSYSDITGKDNVGGIIGILAHSHSWRAEDIDLVGNCFWFGTISAEDYVGGIVGQAGTDTSSGNDMSHSGQTHHSARLTRNVAIGDIKATGNQAGGIVGYAYGGINQSTLACYFTVNNSYFNGSLSGQEFVGGIVGQMKGGRVENNYSNATIEGTLKVGGIVGYMTYFSKTSYSKEYVVPSTLKSNMAVNPSITATGEVGRIYGNIGAKLITIGKNGSVEEDNRALFDTKILISGVATKMDDSEQNGVSNGLGYFKLMANYVAHGWDFTSDWTILETESFPYKRWQAAPPYVTSSLASGDTSISGKSQSGGTVFVKIGKAAWQSVGCSSYDWTLSGISALKSGDMVSMYAVADGKQNSYRTQATASFPGSGTEADPWRIYSAEDLQGVYKAGYYKQMNDIDLSQWIAANSPTKGWTGVGYSGTDPIVYEGDNHKVTGLWANTTEERTGLFSSLPNATIRNLTVEASAKKVTGGDLTAILVGEITNGTLENVKVKGNVVAHGKHAGGVAAKMAAMTVRNVSFEGKIISDGNNWYNGGIVGLAGNTTFSNCKVSNTEIVATYNGDATGLIAGYHAGGIISDCIAEGRIESHAEFIGGLVGTFLLGTSIIRSKANVDITAPVAYSTVGGLIGDAYPDKNGGKVSQCVSAGTINLTGSNSEAGGLIGRNYATIEDCYSTVVVTGTQYTAGLIGENSGKVNRCYASGNVNSQDNGAGLIAWNNGTGALVTNSVALNEIVNVTSQSSWSSRVLGNYSDGAPEPDESNYAWSGMQISVNGVPKLVTSDNILDGQSLSDAAIKQQTTYEALGWDFTDVWGISEESGYPYLLWTNSGDIDLSQYNLVKEFDLAQYNAYTYMVSDGTDQRGTAWEVGNKVYQKIFNVIEPEDFSGYLAIQAYYTGGSSKGWWINRGLQSYAAPRSAAILNRKAGDLIVFESSGNDITTAMTLYNGEGNPDGPFTYQQSADGTKYYVTLTGDSQVGFCGLKNGSPITRIAIYEPLVRPISVKADDLTMTYGEPLPTLTWTATRDGQPTTVSGEPVLTTMATDQSKPGTYTICCNQGTVTTDGALFANGKLTIDKATVTVTAPTLTINKGEAIPDLTPTYTGWVNGWTADMLNTQAICATTATSDSPAGTYLVTYSQNPNSGGYYNFNMVEGTLTIMPQLPENTLYYWIGSLEQGGRAVAQDGESVGRACAGLSTISLLNEKANVDTWGYVDIALDEPLQAGDKISITAFRYQDDDAEGSIYLRFANGTVVDDEYVFPNIHEGYSQEPGEHTWTVGEEAAGSQSIRLTRGKADADLFITNIVIVRGDGSVTPIAPTTDYSLAGVNLVAAGGTQSELEIALTNSGTVRLCQFDLSLPEGVTVTSKANGKPNITLTDRAESHSLSVTRLANGDYRVVVSSLEGDDFAGNSGPLVKAALTIADGMADGEYNVYVRNIVLSLPDGNNLNKVKPADTTSKLTIRNYKPGDVDNDGEVDVNDVGCTINYILEQVPDVFIFEAADMDKDLAIDVNDVGYIINTILGIGNGSRLAEGTFAAAMQATSPGLSLMATGTGYALNGQRMGNIAACQFDVALSDGAVLDGVELSTQAADHVATFRKIADGTYRVVVYSPTGSGLGYEGNNLLRLQTHGSSIAVSNIILSTTSLHKVAMPDLGASTTGIASVYGGLSIKAIGDGRLVVTASGDCRLSVVTAGGAACGELNVKQGTNEFGGFVPGVYIINNKKIVIR